MGFLGILEDNRLPHVPGTVILDEDVAQSQAVTSDLKHGTGRNAHIVLAPQPSDDPNDPLNWSETKKFIIMMIIGLGAILNSSVTPSILNTGIVVIATDFKKKIGNITLITGYQLLVSGCSGPFVSAFARKWGKRPQFLFATTVCFIGTIVGSATTSYKGFLASRIIQGFGTNAYESLTISLIGDIYFVHERGLWASYILFLLTAISQFPGIITGSIVTHLGWKYLFHILAAFLGFQLIVLFLFVPETTYNRDHSYDIDELVDENLEKLASRERRHRTRGTVEDGALETKDGARDSEEDKHLERIQTADSRSAPPPRKTFLQEIAIFTGTYSDENILQLILAPFGVCTNLAVLWAMVVQGYLIATTVAVLYVLAQIFVSPPYLLSISAVGYLSVGPFLGGLIASVSLAFIMDPMIKWASGKNNGVYEPEYRLLPMVGGLIGGAGLMGFGAACEAGKSYYATTTLHGLLLFGSLYVLTSSSAYVLDGYREMSNEIFVMAAMIKSFFFYGFSWFVNDWTETAGPRKVFLVFGGVNLAVTVTTPIVFILGKRYRSFWSRYNILELLHIKTHAK